MTDTSEALVLPEGWVSQVMLHSNDSGKYGGRAELLRSHTMVCVLVALNAGSASDAMRRLQRLADVYVAEIAARKH